ncbi:phosphogluconate dehydrogenase (decarboxylating) gnd1 [Pestalotiopsis sp. IQ-011]
MATTMTDPSQGIHRELLPHVHLLSTFRYTQKPRIEVQEVAQMLMNAPSIARDKAPFFWTYLDKPENGTTVLTWQPLQLLGTNFASDGYIWPPSEQYFTQDMGNGIILEMWFHKAGYAYGEPMAMHSRRRFRLCPNNAMNPNAPQIDPSLWIVHYGPIDGNERIPVNMIPRDPRLQAIMEARNYLQRSGQIQRKEFMLSDRVNWPQIAWPREMARQPMYPANRPVPQTMAYPTHPQAGAPPSKRARTGQAGNQPPVGLTPDDDDEDYSRGDVFDHLTPREISLHRYQQNHEWMEEILSSPYRMSQISFANLGLGLKGELGGLTNGIFEAQGIDALSKPSQSSETHLDKDKAAEFRARVSERIETTNAEIAKMKADHERKLAKFKKNSILMSAEKELRTATDDVSPGPLSLERPEENDEDAPRWTSKHSKKVEDIVSQVEAQLGRRAEVIHDLKRIQDGGYQEPAPEPIPEPVPEPSAGGDSEDVDMSGTAGGLLDQIQTGASSTSTPGNNFPTPQGFSAAQSGSGTPANANGPTAAPQAPPAATEAPDASKQQDVDMGGTDAAPASAAAANQGTGADDWVVVPKGGVSPDDAAPASAAPAPAATAAPSNDTAAPKAPSRPASKQASASGTPGAGSVGFDNDFGSLGDLDSAGDALASFSDTPADMGGDFMEDSAFGDAFHGVEAGGDDNSGNTPAGDTNL